MITFIHTPVCRLVSKILVFIMVFQTFPLWELSQRYKLEYRPDKAQRIIHFISELIGPASAEAAPAPDLNVTDVDASGVITDGQTLEVSGNLQVQIQNIGDADVTAPFSAVAFEDSNGNGTYDSSADVLLGSAVHSTGLTASSSLTLPVSLSGTVSFKGNIIYAFVDSDNVIAESDETNNIRHSGQSSVFIPPVGVFSPQLEWSWTSSSVEASALNVMMTPSVIDINADAIPDVVFASTASTGGALVEVGFLRALNGADGSEIFTVTDPSLQVNTAASIAAGDIDLDGLPEIIACDSSGVRLIAFEHDGTFKWRSPNLEAIYWGAPSIANIDGSGPPEIIIGRQVLNSDGSVRWTGSGGRASQGNVGPISVVADINMDGSPDVIAGNTVYTSAGAIHWMAPLPDGHNAIGNFDDDTFPEIVLVSGGSVRLLEHDGTVKWGPVAIPGGGAGGPPTIADYDSDGEAEIGVAGASRYAVFETDGSLKWAAVTQDRSSNRTGSSVFDFDGDGSAEVVYRDELRLRVYRGSDGFVLFETPMSSCTWHEYVLVADVDADGNAEIVAVANNNCGFGPQRGVFVFGDENDNWVATRKIWNEHAYHITNVNEDGTIPAVEQNNWLVEGLNNYRLNEFLPDEGGSTDAPDLIPSFIRVDGTDCPQSAIVTARVGNGGALLAPVGVNVSFYIGDPGAGGVLKGTAQTSVPLNPGEFEDVSIVWNATPVGEADIFVVADDNGSGTGAVNEGDEDNNIASTTELICGCADDLSVRPKSSKIQLTWTPLPAAASYDILRSTEGSDRGFSLIAADHVTDYATFLDTGLANGVPYWYQVIPKDVNGAEICVSNTVFAVPVGRTPRGLVTVPVVVGLIQADAEAVIGGVRLTVGAVSTASSNTVPAGDVISQDPAGGTNVVLGTAVDIVVSLGPVTVAVPDVVGLGQAAAEAAILGAGLTVGNITTASSNTVPAGDVISQNPAGGTNVVLGTAVDIVVSLGPVTVAVPDVVGLGQAAAEAAILGAGLTVGNITTASSNTVPAGDVISQNPAGGTNVVLGTAVDIVVSLGPVTVAVPDVVGLGQAAAEAAILGAGLTVGNITTASSNTVPAGDVISQDPAGGTNVVLGTAVDIVVSLGPVTVAVPDVVGLAQAAAEVAILGAGLTVGNITTANSNTVPAGDVISQDPAGGTNVVLGTAVDIVVSLGPVTVAVPDVVGLGQAAAEAAILGAGLTVGNITTASSNTVPAGDVISQNPAGGTNVVLGTAVDIVVSLGPVTVAVPDVVGLGQAAAEAAILGAGLTVGNITTANSNTVSAGDVISQDPAGGTNVVLGTAVDIVVSLGPVTVAVPDVVGLGQAAAEAAILGAGLTVGNITTASSNTVSAGDVISQDPAGGTNVVLGTAVDIVVSLGPVTVAVPDVVGLGQAAAEAAILGAGLTVGNITTASSNTVPAGDVISQNPAGGTNVVLGTAVDIVVSLGPVAGVLDFLRPEVDVAVDLPVVNVGDSVTITVDATDDVGVVSKELFIDGVPVPLDMTGTATFSSPAAGVFTAEATALDAEGNEGFDSEEFRFLVPGDTTPPTVAITAPADFAVLTGPADIVGTANDDTQLVRYLLEFSVKGKNEFITFAEDTVPVINDVLGQLDPTTMRNGLYDVRLTAEDASGNSASITRIYQLEGEQKVGNFTISFNDLTVPVSGIPITITRTYDSRVKTKGDFGIGWTIELNSIEIQENRIPGEDWEVYCTRMIFGTCIEWGVRPTSSHTVIALFPGDREHEFNVQANSTFAQPSGLAQGQLTFVSQSGTFSSLQALDNTTYDFLLGGELLDLGFNVINPNRYRLTTSEGDSYVLNQSSGIESITEPNGNTITFGSNGIIHSAGKSVTFTRDAQGRITQITDPLGNTIEYVYDFYGDLVSVTDQEGNVTRFTYNSSHGLIDIIDPRGITPARNEYDVEGRIVAHVDANGNRIEYTHDIGGQQEVVKDRLGNVTVYNYDNDGNIISRTDPLGQTTSFTYDARGNTLTETDPLGNSTTQSYDARDNLLTQTDSLGNTTVYTYDAKNQILSTADAKGNTTAFTYDSRGNLLTTSDPMGNVTTNTYDTGGNLLSATDCLGNTTDYEYDSFGNLTKQTDPLGNVTTYTYDANGNQLTQTNSRTDEGGNPVIMTTTNLYDALNRLISTTDPAGNVNTIEYNTINKQSAAVDKNGNRTTYEYDLMGNLVTTTHPDGITDTATFDVNDNKLTATDRGGRTISFEYDSVNQLIRTIFPDGSIAESEYDSAGRVTADIDEKGNRTTYEYDAAGRNTKVIDALGNATIFSYDANGNRMSMTDANGNTYTYEYNVLSQRTKTTLPDGTFTAIGYDCLGRKISETDQAGVTTQFQYDALGRLIKVTDALGGETTYSYDEAGNRISQTDTNGHTTGWAYDSLGREIKHTLPFGMTETFAYDAAGNMVSKSDFNGDSTTFTYDSDNRLLTRTFPDTSSVFFAYTATGQRSTVTDSRGVTMYTYDIRDRIIQVVEPSGDAVSYTYDVAGNRTSVAVPSGTTTNTYDTLNRLSTVTDPNGGTTTYTYDSVGNRASVTYPNGTVTQYTYDALNRLVMLDNLRSDSSVISGYAYTLGPAGNRTRVVEDSGRAVDYTYDSLYRLTQENITDAVLGNQTISYTYDPVGNRLTKTDPGGVTNYIYDTNDRLIAEGSNVYTYDDNGNTLSMTDGVNTTTYAYDFENRLVTAQTPVSLIDYEYDADGIRTSSVVDGVVTDYLVDRNRDHAQVLEEIDGTGALIVSYIYGSDLISQNRSSTDSYYQYDGLGSTRVLTDASENVSDTYTYEAFGILLGSTGTSVNNYLYTGEQLDPNVSFYYLRARWMNPYIGRFISFDQFAGDPQAPISLHKYLYANANPVTYIDPTGQFSMVSLGISMAIGGIINASFYAAFNLGTAFDNPAAFWRGVGFNFAVGALTAPVGGFLTRVFAPVIRASVSPLLSIVGRLGPITLRGRGPIGSMLVNISRAFFNTNATYPKVGNTFLGKILVRMFPRVRWDQHHVIIRQAWSRVGGPNQLYDDIAANEGLRRMGNGLLNLIPLPQHVHTWVHTSRHGAQLLASAYYSIMAFGPTQAALAFLIDW